MLDGGRFHVVAASVSGEAVRVGRVYLDGRLQETGSKELAADTEPGDVLEAVGELLGCALEGAGREVMGVGVAAPGLVDAERGAGLYAANLRGWREVAVGDRLKLRLGRGVLVENEIRCGLWASLWFERLLVEHRDILYLVLSEGVGGALFVRDGLIRGSHFGAGEFGHVRAGEEKRRCGCGKLDCLETYASLRAMLGEVRRLCPEWAAIRDAEGLVRAAAEPVVRNVLDRSMARLAWVTATVAAAFDPSLILLGGQAAGFCELVRPLLEKHLQVELGAMSAAAAPVGVAAAGADGPLLGVAGLVMAKVFRCNGAGPGWVSHF